MARIPKGFRNNININPGKIGPERRQEILDDIADNGTFLPRGVSEEDMDETFVDFVCGCYSVFEMMCFTCQLVCLMKTGQHIGVAFQVPPDVTFAVPMT